MISSEEKIYLKQYCSQNLYKKEYCNFFLSQATVILSDRTFKITAKARKD